MSVTVSYKGATIQTISGTATKTLKTRGKYCEGDIVLANTKDSPTLQSKTLTLGASAPSNVVPDSGKDGLSQVSVALDTNVIKAANIASGVTVLGITGTHQGGIAPTGTIHVVANGDYDVSQYADADVAVPSPTTEMKLYGFRTWDLGTCRQWGATSSSEGWPNYEGVSVPSVGDLIVIDITAEDSLRNPVDYQNIIRVTQIENNEPKGDVIAQIRKGETLGLTYAKEEQTKTITENGTYYPDAGKALSSVTVNVPGGGGTDVYTAINRTTNVNIADENLSTVMARGIYAGTTSMSAGDALTAGVIYIQYEE